MQLGIRWQSSTDGAVPGVLKPAFMVWAPLSKISVLDPKLFDEGVVVAVVFDLAMVG